MNLKNKDKESMRLEKDFQLLNTDCIKMKTSSQMLQRSKGLCLYFKMGHNMRVNGTPTQINVTVGDIKFGLTEVYMKGIGRWTKLMEEGGLFMLTAISIMDIGKTIRLMVSDNTLIQMELNTR